MVKINMQEKFVVKYGVSILSSHGVFSRCYKKGSDSDSEAISIQIPLKRLTSRFKSAQSSNFGKGE